MKTLEEVIAEIEKKECSYPYEGMVYARDVEEILEANWPEQGYTEGEIDYALLTHEISKGLRDLIITYLKSLK